MLLMSFLWFLSLSFICTIALVAGETVSLVDVDISQRGRNSPHPPTPPPPPRRSLSLLGEPHYRRSHTPLISFVSAFLHAYLSHLHLFHTFLIHFAVTSPIPLGTFLIFYTVTSFYGYVQKFGIS